MLYARAVDVFAQQVVIAVVFGDHVGAVMDIAGGIAIDLLFNAPAGYIVLVGDFLPVRGVLSSKE